MASFGLSHVVAKVQKRSGCLRSINRISLKISEGRQRDENEDRGNV